MVNLPAHGHMTDSQDTDGSRTLPSLVRFGRGLMALAVLAFLLAACGASSGDDEEQMPTVASGTGVETAAEKDLAPNFTFTLYQGEGELGASELDLAQLRGEPVVLNFWAGLCPPCRAEMPDLQIFYEQFKGRATLIGIDLGQFTGLGTQKDAKELLEDLGITYPTGYTDDSSVVKKFKVLGMPTTVFIRADGTIFKKWSGALNEETLAKQTNAMLAE